MCARRGGCSWRCRGRGCRVWVPGWMCCVFFFSSRRRHTRCSRDWSSDVCSSDLTWRVNWIQDLIQDLRHALRRLRMAPAFTSATVLTLALGISATTSIFTLVDAVLLKSLPVVNPGELYRLGKEPRCCYQGGYSQEKEFSLVSYDLYKYLRYHTQGFSELAAFPSLELLFGVRRSRSEEH